MPKQEKLLVNLQSPDKNIVIGALRTITWQVEPEAMKQLLSLASTKDEDIRVEVLKALGQVGSERGVPALLDALRDYSDLIRFEVVLALSKIKDPSCVEVLAERLKDPSYNVKKLTIQTLGAIKSPKGLPALEQIALDKAQPLELREYAIKAAGEIGLTQIPKLVDLLSEPEISLQREVVVALGKTQNENAIDILLDVLQDDTRDKVIRRFAKSSLESLVEWVKTHYLQIKERVDAAIRKSKQ